MIHPNAGDPLLLLVIAAIVLVTSYVAIYHSKPDPNMPKDNDPRPF